jgi:amino acid adenylation domain-containing protein
MKENTITALDEYHEAEQYWLQNLAGELNAVALPREKKAKPGATRAEYSGEYPPELVAQLARISGNNDLALYVMQLTALKIVLYKVTRQEDIIVASPVYTVASGEKDGYVLFRDRVRPHLTYKELLYQVKNTVSGGYKNQVYPVINVLKSLEQQEPDALFDVLQVHHNIHTERQQQEAVERNNNGITVLNIRTGQTHAGMKIEDTEIRLTYRITYNAGQFSEETVRQLAAAQVAVLQQAVADTGISIRDIRIMTEQEKHRVLMEFNAPGRRTDSPELENLTLHRWFQNQAEKTPDKTAVVSTVDLTEVLQVLETGTPNDTHYAKLGKCVFRSNPYIYRYESPALLKYAGETVQLQGTEPEFLQNEKFTQYRTHKGNIVALNGPLRRFLECLDGNANLKSIATALGNRRLKFITVVFDITPGKGRVTSDTHEIIYEGDFKQLARQVEILYRTNQLQMTGYSAGYEAVDIEIDTEEQAAGEETIGSLRESPLPKRSAGEKQPGVLLLGDTMGTGTTGLLYLASYLRRNGVEAYVQWNDLSGTVQQMKEKLEKYLENLQPTVVGISMKWFPHIARVYKICEIVKDYNPAIQTVVGGNTASYYWENVIQNQYVDAVVVGDGEEPLLKIARGEKKIPNTTIKKKGKIKAPTKYYVQDKTNHTDVYISHRDEIFLDPLDPYLTEGTYINTGKGCNMQCFYCGGCRSAQQTEFRRSQPYLRDVEVVRRDMMTMRTCTSTLVFDFDLPLYDSMEYYRTLWEGEDWTGHFCEFYFWKLPEPELIRLLTRTFKYVYLNIDICSLSEAHRKRLEEMGQVKPQPTDRELNDFFRHVEAYDNVDVTINQIAGLPTFDDKDIAAEQKVVKKILAGNRRFKKLSWGRLHAQPGAPLVETAPEFDMYSAAVEYEDFFDYSRRNLEDNIYPTLEQIHYPNILPLDEHRDSAVIKHYIETNKWIEQYRIPGQSWAAGEETVSYKQLNRRVRQLSHYLRIKGVQTAAPVAVKIGASVEQAAALLGVLTAGAAYVPIEPDTPQERIDYMMADSNARIMVTEETMAAMTEDMATETMPPQDRVNDPVPYNTPADPVNIIYTSGTTGKPRGIVVNHRGLVNYTEWRRQAYGISQSDVALQPLSHAFDGFGSNFYSTLLTGGTLVQVPAAMRLDMARQLEMIKEYGVTNVSQVPGQYRMMLDRALEGDLDTLRFVVLAGEEADAALIRESREKAPNARLINEYGPTEATVTAVARLDIDENTTDHIGTPIHNTAIVIMDPDGQPLPPMIPGELCVAGTGVTRGYLNNPELTAERFLQPQNLRNSLSLKELFSPDSSVPPVPNLYKTGDRARWLPDGTLQYLGRLDRQVKIRGNRIEPDEIAQRLQDHEAVETVEIIPVESKRLDAYVVAATPVTPAQLRRYLAERLPAYMIPDNIIPVEEMPLTVNGKVDRKALEKYREKMNTGNAYIPPETEMEKTVALQWQDVLKREKTSIDDNFFDHGGNSMLMVEVTNRLNEILGKEIPIVKMFEFTTIRTVARYLESTGDMISETLEKEMEDVDAMADEGMDQMQQTLQILGGEQDE